MYLIYLTLRIPFFTEAVKDSTNKTATVKIRTCIAGSLAGYLVTKLFWQ